MSLRYAWQVCSCEHTQAYSCARDSFRKTMERDKTEKRVKRFNNVNIAPE